MGLKNGLYKLRALSVAGFVMWNSVQAISSYVRGVLSSHAVFKGVGVGSQVMRVVLLEQQWGGNMLLLGAFLFDNEPAKQACPALI